MRAGTYLCSILVLKDGQTHRKCLAVTVTPTPPSAPPLNPDESQ